MGLFDQALRETRLLLDRMARTVGSRTWRAETTDPWLGGRGNLLIPASDTSVELGPPDLPSALMTLITEQPASIQDGLITLVGPDIGDLAGRRAPLGKILLVEATGIAGEALYDFYVDVNLARLDVSLSGYMTRASSGRKRDWCRISQEAVRGGMSLAHIGASEIACVKRVAGVKAAEMAVMTASWAGVAALSEIASRVDRIASALCKLSKEILHDCGNCEFSDLCASLSDLKRLRGTTQGKTGVACD